MLSVIPGGFAIEPANCMAVLSFRNAFAVRAWKGIRISGEYCFCSQLDIGSVSFKEVVKLLGLTGQHFMAVVDSGRF
jgi:hypothetical protein